MNLTFKASLTAAMGLAFASFATLASSSMVLAGTLAKASLVGANTV